MIRLPRIRRLRSRRNDRAFTLIELMLSIALVLLLMVGVNYIFKSTSEAVSAGQAINQFSRDDQSAQFILFNDLNNAEKNPPFFGFASRIDTNFLDSVDAQSGSNPANVVIDNGAGAPLVIGTDLSPAIYNSRSHRYDLLKFFAHGNYTRHSSDDASFTSNTTSTDAFITLGHALLPTYDQAYFIGPTTDPIGILNSPNPFQLNGTTSGGWYVTQLATANVPPALKRVGSYSSDGVLARNVILLKAREANVIAPEHYLPVVSTAILQNTLKATGSTTTWYPYGAVNLSPLGYYSPDDQGRTVIQSSRYDFANVTMEQFRRIVADAYIQNANAAIAGPQSGVAYPLWWLPMLYNLGAFGGAPLNTGATANTPQYNFGYVDNNNNIQTGTAGFPLTPGLARMAANPLIQSPLNAAALAQMAPYFIQHCSQFVVEYSGDYLQQDGNASIDPNVPTGSASSLPGTLTGQITGIGKDGQIDYVIKTDPAGNRYKAIRWYGMPRSSNQSAPNTSTQFGFDALNYPNATSGITIRGYNPGVDHAPAIYATHGIMEEFVDVIPLRDYYRMYFDTAITPNINPANYPNLVTPTFTPPWEVDLNFDPPMASGSYRGGDYAYHPGPQSGQLNHAFGQDARFASAWYNDTPAMIRILVKVDDPNHKVQDGPWYEFVFKLK